MDSNIQRSALATTCHSEYIDMAMLTNSWRGARQRICPRDRVRSVARAQAVCHLPDPYAARRSERHPGPWPVPSADLSPCPNPTGSRCPPWPSRPLRPARGRAVRSQSPHGRPGARTLRPGRVCRGLAGTLPSRLPPQALLRPGSPPDRPGLHPSARGPGALERALAGRAGGGTGRAAPHQPRTGTHHAQKTGSSPGAANGG
jgi:hypothetical protein